MRLPQKSEGVIDVEQTKVMVDKFYGSRIYLL